MLVIPAAMANSETRQFIEFFDKNDPKNFQAVHDDLIASGQSGDVGGMLAITSPNTKHKFGVGQLRAVSLDKYVLLLKSCSSFTESLNVTAVSDAQTRTAPAICTNSAVFAIMRPH